MRVRKLLPVLRLIRGPWNHLHTNLVRGFYLFWRYHAHFRADDFRARYFVDVNKILVVVGDAHHGVSGGAAHQRREPYLRLLLAHFCERPVVEALQDDARFVALVPLDGIYDQPYKLHQVQHLVEGRHMRPGNRHLLREILQRPYTAVELFDLV